MREKLFKYEVKWNHIFIVDRYQGGNNVFYTLTEAKQYLLNNPYRIHPYEIQSWKDSVRGITTAELFDDLFDLMKEDTSSTDES